MLDPAILPPDLRAMAAAVERPELGFFGPRSITWHIAREHVLFMGGPRALLMQLAHPHVAQGVSEHSQFLTDPLGRSLRTFSTVYRMLFGSVDTAVQVALRTRAIHGAVKGHLRHDAGAFAAGSRYHANRGDLLFWVHATLIDSAIYIYELTVRPLTPGEKAQYYEESKTFAKLFGTQNQDIPPTYADFQAYVERTVAGTLAVSPAARALAAALLRGPSPAFRPLAPGAYLVAGGTLPPRLREAYALPWNRGLQLAFDQAVRAVRLAVPRLPPQVRYLPAYRKAVHASGGRAARAPGTHRA
jgi:uncharacterized protein (DUF2236 family)